MVNYPYQIANLCLAIEVTHLLRGTPYIYHGEEIGMTNPGYQELAQYNDVETHNNYQIMRGSAAIPTKVKWTLFRPNSDNSRTPMQWGRTAHAGFTSTRHG